MIIVVHGSILTPSSNNWVATVGCNGGDPPAYLQFLRFLLPAAACCCLLLPAAACCCLLLPAAACCCLLLLLPCSVLLTKNPQKVSKD
jgi:hypothetical protein